jgi:hypothetical protein
VAFKKDSGQAGMTIHSGCHSRKRKRVGNLSRFAASHAPLKGYLPLRIDFLDLSYYCYQEIFSSVQVY